MEKQKATPFRIIGAIVLVLASVLWGVLGLLLVAGSARNSGSGGQLWTIVLVVLWLGGLAAFIGGAVWLVRPALQQVSTHLGKRERKRL